MPIIRIALLTVWTGTILYLTLSPSPIESTGSVGLYALLKAAVAWVAPMVDAGWVIAKTFHFVAYGLWAWLLAGVVAGGYGRPWTSRQVWLCVGALVLLSVAQEAMQGLVPTRHASARDVLINIAGGLMALGLRPVLCGCLFRPTGPTCPTIPTGPRPRTRAHPES